MTIEASRQYIGFLLWNSVIDADTRKEFWIERMLWVRPEFRGSRAAWRLLRAWENTAKATRRSIALHAGASLKNPENAQRVYEKMGFRTTFTFQKEVTHV